MEELGEKLWVAVSDGKVKQLDKFLVENKNDKSLVDIINYKSEIFDEDGGNVIKHCVKLGRDKPPSFGKDFGAIIATLVQHGAEVDAKDKAKRTPLFLACRLKYVNTVKVLLYLGADPNIRDQDDNTPFHISVQLGHKDVTSLLLDNSPKLVGVHGSHGAPPLVIAVKYSQLETSRLLLERGADVNSVEQKTKRSPTYHAIRNKHLEILELLLRYNPDINTIDTEGRSILYLVCECTDSRFFQRILAYCPKFSKKIMDTPADDNKTPLIIACQQGNADQVKHLLEEGADTKAVDVYRKSGLHYCTDNLETQCAELLLAKDPTIIDFKDEQGYTALALSVLVGNINLMKLLLEKGADIETRDEEGHKLAHWAAVCGHLKILDVLVQHGADMESKDTHHAYPIHYAAQMNSQNSGINDPKISEKVLKKVLDCKVSLSVVDDTGRQPLLWAACSGNAESCRMLLKAGADINSVDNDELTALHCAASRGHSQCIEVLRKHGGDLNKTDKNKCTPLFYAITLGNKECTKAILTSKSDAKKVKEIVNHADARGRNPAHCAAIKGCLDTIKMLEKEECDMWLQNNKGDYPVHEAAQKGHLDVVRYLLRQRNDVDAVNVVNNVGKTLLHIAAATNNLPLCKLLMNNEACNKNALMTHGDKTFTPYDLAIIKGYSETGEYLKSKGALPHADIPNIVKTKEKEKKAEEKKPDEKKSEGKKSEEKKSEDKKSNDKKEVKRPPSAKAEKPTANIAVVNNKKKQKQDNKDDKAEIAKNNEKNKIKEDENVKKKEDENLKKTEQKEEKTLTEKVNVTVINSEKGKPSEQETESKPKVEPPKEDKPVETDKRSKDNDTIVTKSEPPIEKKDVSKKQNKAKASNTEIEKADPIRASYTSLRQTDSAETKNVTTQDNQISETETATSPMGQTNTKKPQEAGKYVSLETYKDSEIKHEQDESAKKINKRSKNSKVGFNDTARSETEDSGNETDGNRSPRKKLQTSKKAHTSFKKGYVNSVKDSVRTFHKKRNTSRSLQQLRRAQIHSGPMHDIVMFSKMMDHYRQGLGPEEADIDVRQYANWDGYLNDQLRFVSHLYSEDSKSPRDLQETAKDRQVKRNKEMDREIDQLASRTAEMFDSIQHGASTSLNSAKTRNQKLRDEMRKTREEKLRTTEDSYERAVLQRQEMEDRLAEQQEELDSARRIQHKNWYRRKDEEMRQRLLMAYRPTFPNDVFASKSVCISGGRVKSAGMLRIDSGVTPRPRRTQQSPRPGSQKSGDSSNYSAAQFRQKEESMQVQMTPYGLRRIRNQERPTYANWSRKYDGSIRPRTGLVFVEPRVYDDLMREEKEAKQRISTSVRHQYTNGTISQNSTHSTENSDSPLP